MYTKQKTEHDNEYRHNAYNRKHWSGQGEKGDDHQDERGGEDGKDTGEAGDDARQKACLA